MAKKSQDKVVAQLLQEVKQKKSEIEISDRLHYKTNMSLPLDSAGLVRKNLQVESDVDVLASLLGFLSQQYDQFNTGRKALGLPEKQFKWFGFTYQEWLGDIKTRVTKIQVSTKKKELDILEKRLDSLVSKDLRDQMELEEIMKELKG